jgi:hypothetical protein
MERRTAIRLAAELMTLLGRRGEDYGQGDRVPDSKSPQGALARIAAERVPADAIAAVFGDLGGDLRFVAVSPGDRCLYLLEPIKFETEEAQNASARCRVVPVDGAQSSVEITTRWWGIGEDNRRTEWRISVGSENLHLITERDLDEDEPRQERVARILCEAAQLPLTAQETEPTVTA